VKAYELAKAEIGTVEWRDGNNPKVVAYFKDSGNAGVKDDETAWCAAFVGAMLARSGVNGTGKLNARSYLQWGEHVDRSDARPGDIVVFKRGNSSWQGHVAFFVSDTKTHIQVLGGNQADAVNVKSYRAADLLGIRRAKLTRPAPHVTEPPKSEHDRLRDAVAQLDAKPVRTPAVQGWLAALIDAVLRLFKVRK